MSSVLNVIDPNVNAFLASLGLLNPGLGLNWESAVAQPDVLAVVAQTNEGNVVVRVVPADPTTPSFFSSRSFAWSYGSDSSASPRTAARLLESIRGVVEQFDRGGLRLPEPAPVSADTEPKPGSTAKDEDDWGVDPVAPTMDAFRLVEIHVDELESLANGLEGINGGEVELLVIKGVYTANDMRLIEDRLNAARGDDAWHIIRNPGAGEEPQPYLIGDVLIPASYQTDGANFEGYLGRADTFREEWRNLFEGLEDFESRVGSILGQISGGRPVGLPPTAAGESYLPATIRALPKGANLAVHVGNHFRNHPSYDDLKAKADLSNQLSYFLTIAAAEEGGELVVYRHRYDQDVVCPADSDLPVLSQFEDDSVAFRVRPAAGELLIFDGGRYYHRVSTVETDSWRWTMGGFLAFSLNHDAFYFWS